MSEHGEGLRIVTKLGERCTAVPLRIVTKLGERCTAVPLQVKGNDKTKLEVHGSVRTWLKVSLQVQGSDKTK